MPLITLEDALGEIKTLCSLNQSGEVCFSDGMTALTISSVLSALRLPIDDDENVKLAMAVIKASKQKKFISQIGADNGKASVEQSADLLVPYLRAVQRDLTCDYFLKKESEYGWVYLGNKIETSNVDKFKPIYQQMAVYTPSVVGALQDRYEATSKKKEFDDFVAAAFNKVITQKIRDILIPEMKMLCWSDDLSESQYALKVFDSNLLTKAPTPHWDALLHPSRVSHPDIVKAFIGSIFNFEDEGRQILWCYGIGQCGMSTMWNVIARALGTQYMASDTGFHHNQFTSSKFQHKRLAYVADPDAGPNVMKSNIIRNISGGDEAAAIERKNQNATVGKLYCKVVVYGNNYPKDIDLSDKALESRTLLVTFDSLPDNQVELGFDQKLYDEVWPFIRQCREVYLQLRAKKSWRLPIDANMLRRIQTSCEEPWSGAVRRFLEKEVVYKEGSTISETAFLLEFKVFARSTAKLPWKEKELPEKHAIKVSESLNRYMKKMYNSENYYSVFQNVAWKKDVPESEDDLLS